MRRWFVLLPLVLLTACAGAVTKLPTVETSAVYEEAKKQRALVVKEYINSFERLQRLAYPILLANYELCGEEVTYLTGMFTANADGFNGEMREAMVKLRNLDEFIKVVYVVPNSPAAKAGVKAGDTLITINGNQIAYGEGAEEKFDRQISKIQKTGERITLELRRNDKAVTAAITPAKACNYPVYLDASGVDNAYATGTKIVFYQGLMRADNDTAVALTIGHELAHNIMRHPQKGMQNAVAGGFLGALVTGLTGVNVVNTFSNAGRSMNQRDFESEADYVGTYLMARAGYDISDAADAWRATGIRAPQQISHGSSHPPGAERFLAVEKAVAEIGVKRSKGQKLIPNDFHKLRDDEAEPTANTDEVSN